jgi:hypothetical protein
MLICVGLLLGAATTQARPEYMALFAADPLARPELRNRCAVCHVNPSGGGERNAFGQAFDAAGRRITPELRQRFPGLFRAEGEPQAPPVTFVKDSPSEAIVELNGRRYRINTKDQTVTLLEGEATRERGAPPPVQEPAPVSEEVFQPMDVRLVNLPTGIAIPKGSLWVDFTHRFPFGDISDGIELFGLDSFAVPSFGLTYGITDRFHIGAYRSPTIVGRPIEVFAGVSLLDEGEGHPLTAMGRVAIEGRDNFRRNFTTSFELTLARSLTRHAQLYVVPTVSVGDRPLVGPDRNFKGRTAVALGIGAAVNVRPSVALMAEANLRSNEDSRYVTGEPEFGRGIHRPVVGFGIQKVSISRRHAFTLTFSNGPGTTFAQRSMTNGLLFGDETFGGLSIGFNLSRRLF